MERTWRVLSTRNGLGRALGAAVFAGGLATCALPETAPGPGQNDVTAASSTSAAPGPGGTTAPELGGTTASELGAVASACASAEAGGGASEPLPRPGRGRMLDAVKRDTECQQCHPDEAEEQRRSFHRRSAVDPAYRAAFAIEPSPFCEGCHAPEVALDAAVVAAARDSHAPAAALEKAAPAAVIAMGVGCVTCHVTEDGAILAAPREGGSADSASPRGHAVRRSRAFAAAGGCAGCHEFPFPRGVVGKDDGDFMQTTVREHARSKGADRGCADCHMPLVSGRRSHAFAEVRDPAWLRERLHASAARVDEGTVRITLVQSDPGHAFPTGDLFRRLAVGCEVRSSRGEVLARDVRYPRRHFDVTTGMFGRVLTADDRVFDAPVEIDLDVSAAAERIAPGGGAKVRWWVIHQRVATAGAGPNPEDAKVESEVPLHRGEMAW
ncbi:MAG: hypothetical protein U0441_30105 [Polyangiaceae bacterium]